MNCFGALELDNSFKFLGFTVLDMITNLSSMLATTWLNLSCPGASWAALGGSWVRLGGVLGAMLADIGFFLAAFLSFWGDVGQCWRQDGEQEKRPELRKP